ncbi:MAG: FGGY-family carbohydrate kinase [Chloroflexi bacterium]|nr:FGGY-family carbohydrate kinase [Chloroflexota bacterium]
MARPDERHVVAIDMGSSRLRCLVVDLRGRIAGLSLAEWTPGVVEELAPVGRAIDPKRTWELIARLVRSALRDAGVRPRQVAAVTATSQREGIVLLDADGVELYAGPNSDARAFFEGQAIDDEHGDEVYRVTGHVPSLLFVPAKLRWFQIHQPELFERVRTVLSLDSWILFKLSGEPVIERSAAAEIGMLDVARGDPATDLLQRLGVPGGILPRLVEAGQPIGEIGESAASRTGLPRGTPVVAGGPDTQCGLLGMGIVGAGQVGIVAGSTAPVQMALDRLVLDDERRTWSSLHLLPGTWVLESNIGSAGTAFEWVVETVAPGATARDFRAIERMAARSPAGSDGVLAFVGPRLAHMRELGPRWGGLLFPVPSPTGPIDRGQLVRAVMENVAFAIKANVAQLESIVGAGAERVALGGGMARSATFRRIVADCLGREIQRPRAHEVTSLGAAMAAAVGVGAYGDLRAAAKAMARLAPPVKPDPVMQLEYEEHYQRWLAVGEGLKDMTDTL